MRIGIISDTHGLLRPEALALLRGADHLIHAGDVGDPKILDELAAIAPLTAIRGNVDHTGPCAALPETEAIELGGRLIYVIHAIADLDLKPGAAGIQAVIYGHSHKAAVDWKEGVLFLNPGSAGPRRFSLPLSVAILHLKPDGLHPEILPLSAS